MHRGLEPGRVLEVEVGPKVSDHRGEARIFYRTDGHGRFVLREAHRKPDLQEKNHQLALSLSRSTAGMLERLKPGERLLGHAIPRRQPGCITITFLGLLRSHWDSNLNRPEQLSTIRSDGTPDTARFYRGIAAEAQNDSGWATATSAIRDPKRGIEHLFRVRVFDPKGETSVAGAPAVSVGEPIIFQVRRETARLAVGGLPVAHLLDVLDAYPDAFHRMGPLRDRASVSADGKTEPEQDLAQLETVPSGWYLPARGTVSVRAARRLAELKPTSREWVSDCWYFWARSRHLQTSTNDGFRPAADGSRIDISADATVLGAKETDDLAPVTVSCVAPSHWANLVRVQGENIAALFGASSVTVDGREVIAAFEAVGAAEAALPRLTRVLSSPAALIEYPPQGDRISRGRRDYALLPMAERGMYVANLDWKKSRVTVVGDTLVFARCIDEMAHRLALTTGWMRVPDPRNNGLLIGEKGAQVNALRASSGCTSAQSHGRGTVDWDLAGPAPSNIHAFIRLAQEIVPGVVGDVTETVAATVMDLSGRQNVEGPLTHPWTSFPEYPPRIEVHNPLSEDSNAPDTVGLGVPDIDDARGSTSSPRQLLTRQQPASPTEDLLRSVISAVRAGKATRVDPAMMTDLPLDCVLSFLAGLAYSRPGTRLQDHGAAGFEIIPAGNCRELQRTPTGSVRRYSLDRADTALHAPTTMLLMGDTVVIDMAQAKPEEAAQITYYFAGLSAGLSVPCRSSGTDSLVVG